MRVLLQRVREARVEVEGHVIGSIGQGLLLLVGIGQNDSEVEARKLAAKVLELRVFADAQGRFEHSVAELGLGLLVVPQFTLYADTTKGRRPDFGQAMRPEPARELFDYFVRELRSSRLEIQTGEFGAMMHVSLVNDGPVTILLEN